jgi:hypothetical protein
MVTSRHGLLVLAALVWIAAPALPAESGWQLRASDGRAQRILQRAIAALGGAEPLGRIHNFWMRGRHDTSISGLESSGAYEVAARSPDAVRLVEGFDWTTNLAVRTADGPLFWVGDIRHDAYRPLQSILDDPGRRSTAHRALLAEATRHLLVSVLSAPRSIEAVASDGGKWTIGNQTFDSLSIAGAGDFTARLGFDPTGLPARLGDLAPRPRRSTDATDPRAAPAHVVWELRDYRPIHGVRFPHEIVMRMDNVPFRQIHVREFSVDAALPADFFNPRSK